MTIGMVGGVQAIAWDDVGSRLFVAGNFSQISGISANRIAEWRMATGAWRSLGSGISGTSPTIYALSWHGATGELCAGGAFSIAGGQSVSNLACWDGVSWIGFPTTLSGQVNTLARIESNGALYIGGAFALSGSPGQNLAKTVSGREIVSIGEGTSGTVTKLTIDPNLKQMIVAGLFSRIDNENAALAIAAFEPNIFQSGFEAGP